MFHLPGAVLWLLATMLEMIVQVLSINVNYWQNWDVPDDSQVF